MTICYIHGLNSSHRSFGFVRQNLPDHTGILINYDSHQPLEESLKRIEASLPTDKELAIVGHSLGGVIGTLLAHRLPQVKKLAVISAPIGGSRAAKLLRWVPNHPAVIDDLSPESKFIVAASSIKLKIPTISIISTGGHIQLPASLEKNDSIVTLASQRALPSGRKVEVNANHFEVLMHEKTVDVLDKFLFGDAA